MTKFRRLLEANSIQKKGIKVNDNIKEPIDPEMVLLGLIFVSFLPLNILPKIKPPISESIDTKIEYIK